MEAKKLIALLMFVFLLLFAVSVVSAEKENDPKGPNEEQNQEQNVDSGCNESEQQHQEQNQEQNGNGSGEGSGDGSGDCNNSGEQNKEQNKDGGGAQNQEQNGDGSGEGSGDGSGDCNDSGYRNQEQNKAQNGDGNGEGKEGEGENKYRWRYQYRHQIQQGIENGTVVKECNISVKEGKTYMNSYEYQKGMEVEIEEQNQHRLQIKVSAEYQEGKVLVLNVEKNAFKVENSNQIKVKFDGKEINEASIDDVIDGKGTEAEFAAVLGEDGGQYIVYIPYFSEHTITIEALGVTESEVANFILGAIGAAIFTVIIFVLIVVKIGKFRK